MLLLLATNADDAYDNCDALDGVAVRQQPLAEWPWMMLTFSVQLGQAVV